MKFLERYGRYFGVWSAIIVLGSWISSNAAGDWAKSQKDTAATVGLELARLDQHAKLMQNERSVLRFLNGIELRAAQPSEPRATEKLDGTIRRNAAASAAQLQITDVEDNVGHLRDLAVQYSASVGMRDQIENTYTAAADCSRKSLSLRDQSQLAAFKATTAAAAGATEEAEEEGIQQLDALTAQYQNLRNYCIDSQPGPENERIRLSSAFAGAAKAAYERRARIASAIWWTALFLYVLGAVLAILGKQWEERSNAAA